MHASVFLPPFLLALSPKLVLRRPTLVFVTVVYCDELSCGSGGIACCTTALLVPQRDVRIGGVVIGDNKYLLWCLGAVFWGVTNGCGAVADALLADSTPTGPPFSLPPGKLRSNNTSNHENAHVHVRTGTGTHTTFTGTHSLALAGLFPALLTHSQVRLGICVHAAGSLGGWMGKTVRVPVGA